MIKGRGKDKQQWEGVSLIAIHGWSWALIIFVCVVVVLLFHIGIASSLGHVASSSSWHVIIFTHYCCLIFIIAYPGHVVVVPCPAHRNSVLVSSYPCNCCPIWLVHHPVSRGSYHFYDNCWLVPAPSFVCSQGFE